MCEVLTVRMYHVHEGVKSFTLSQLLSHALSLHNSKRMFTLFVREGARYSEPTLMYNRACYLRNTLYFAKYQHFNYYSP